MNNYESGSMLKTVRELLSTSRLTDNARRTALIEYAVGQVEAVLTQECEAGRNPHPQSWQAVRVAHAVLSGERVRQGAAASAIHAAHTIVTIAACDDTRPAYPAASAAYEVGMAATGYGVSAVRDAVRALLCVSHYAYTVNIKEHGFTVAIAAERAIMDSHESNLRVLLEAE